MNLISCSVLKDAYYQVNKIRLHGLHHALLLFQAYPNVQDDKHDFVLLFDSALAAKKTWEPIKVVARYRIDKADYRASSRLNYDRVNPAAQYPVLSDCLAELQDEVTEKIALSLRCNLVGVVD